MCLPTFEYQSMITNMAESDGAFHTDDEYGARWGKDDTDNVKINISFVIEKTETSLKVFLSNSASARGLRYDQNMVIGLVTMNQHLKEEIDTSFNGLTIDTRVNRITVI